MTDNLQHIPVMGDPVKGFATGYTDILGQNPWAELLIELIGKISNELQETDLVVTLKRGVSDSSDKDSYVLSIRIFKDGTIEELRQREKRVMKKIFSKGGSYEPITGGSDD